ncbi:MAG: HAMP domain-containing histidine kinase [Gemmatimonadetes bacterium]|nr:HAMP domain-containing histidine kinase [Gemmatimonadota bacterium]
MSRWPLLWVGATGAAGVVAAEWMRSPGWVLALGLGVLGGCTLASARRLSRERESGSMVALSGATLANLLVALVVVFTWRLGRIERQWPAVREARIASDSRRLGDELEGAVQLVRELAERAAPALALPPARAFTALEPLISSGDLTHGVVLFDGRGEPLAWAGPQRVALAPDGPPLAAVMTPFYLWLVARRQADAGTAVATLLLARDSAVPPAGVAFADRFARRTGDGLRFYDPGRAPADSDVFDYRLAGDTLFAVQPVPPEQGVVRDRMLAGARRLVFWTVAVLLLVGAAGGVRLRRVPPAPLLPVAAAFIVIARAPLKETFGPGSLFWPDTYYRGLLGPYSASAGALLLLGGVTALLGCAVWRRGILPSFWSRAVALAVAVLAPYLLQNLARGITPPTGGVTTGLWLTWQIALVLAASAVVLLAAAVVRGPKGPERVGPWAAVAGAIAIAAAVAGLWLWQPAGAWPEWYPYLWVPALLVALKPMPFRGTIATVAIVAGSAAALLTWGATTEGRIALATRDLEGLGPAPDPLAVALLDRLVHETPADAPPSTAGDLYRLWRTSALGAQGYPASLALWTAGGERLVGLDLAQLDLPSSFVQATAREAREEGLPVVRSHRGVPGLHGVAGIPLGDRVLTVGVGPRSQLVAPSRMALFLAGGTSEPDAPYQVALSPPERPGTQPTAHVAWRRDGWAVRGERVIDLPGGPRHVHALVRLRGASALLQRGALVLVLDCAILALLWLLVEVLDGRSFPAFRAWWPRAFRSLRARLSVSLALFFVLPTLAFAAWSYGRLGDEFRSARELLLQRTLRDAGTALGAAPEASTATIVEASHRVDAELLLSHGGRLVAASAQVLQDLGLTDWLVSAPVFTRLVHGDELELSAEQAAAPAPTLMGYRLLARGQGAAATILAAPELLGDVTLRRREGDLGIAVLVATMIGLVAALVLSGIAARALARPLQRLRRAALAVGSGAAPAERREDMPAELEPVHAAIVQAAADVEAGQRAQRVIAWGEMARQVAHEIKNPLTPIRLGVQHLLRLHRERPAELGAVLNSTGERILAEIDRLDAIARTFSRFALPGAEGRSVEAVDLPAVAREVLHLYRLGEGPTAWELEAQDGVVGLARRDELIEVLVNLCENARDAGATRVVVSVRAGRQDGGTTGGAGDAFIEVCDDGRGIPPDVLPRVFEPQFSTTTSGSGLGLAIAKRLVESWGGSIGIASAAAGTTITMRLARPENAPG